MGFPDISVNLRSGLFANPRTPKPAYDRLVSAVGATMKDPELSKKLSDAGFLVAYKAPAEFSKLMNDQWDIFARVIKEANLKVD